MEYQSEDMIVSATINAARVVACRCYREGKSDHRLEPFLQPERLMFPFTVTTVGGMNSRTYTLCTSTQSACEQWRAKIEGAQTLRKFDLASNRVSNLPLMTLNCRHTLFTPCTHHRRSRIPLSDPTRSLCMAGML